MDEFYQDFVIEHGRHPHNFREVEDATHEAEGDSPLCGDHMRLQVVLDGGVVKDAAFTGEGCAVCMASASVMTDMLKGMTEEQALETASRFRKCMVEGLEVEELQLQAFLPFRAYPMRVKCATLPWVTVQKAFGAK